MLLSTTIALAGLRRRSLSRSGAIGAIVAGTLTTAFGGYSSAGLLVAFFLSSSALSRLPVSTDRAHPPRLTPARSSQRDIVQVIANGGVSTTLAVRGGKNGPGLPYLGSIAAVTGDTWATEIGARLSAQPRHLITGKPVPAGTSGGVSSTGTIASIAGGAFIGALGALRPGRANDRHIPRARMFFTGVTAGAAGSLVDSLLGATVQERRWCPECQLPTEQPVHRCGTGTCMVGGVRGLNNDVVNAICSLTGALVGYVIQQRSE